LLTALARGMWVTAALTPGQETQFLEAFGSLLRPQDHQARLDRLLAERQTAAIAAQAERVDSAARAVALARLALIRGESGARALVEALPEASQNDPGVRLDHIRALRLADQPDEAIALLETAPAPTHHFESWWSERSRLARTVLQQGQSELAYRLLADHGMKDGNAVSEAEMLAGWVALRKLNRPDLALSHFVTLASKATLNASRSRALFWQAEAQSRMGHRDAALELYRQAGSYSLTFYGQIARDSLHLGPALPPAAPEPTIEDRLAFERQDFTRIARLLMLALPPQQRTELIRPFLARLSEQVPSDGQRVLLAKLALDCGVPEQAVIQSKRLERTGQTLYPLGYPLQPLPPQVKSPEEALVLGIIRQESQFQADVVSSAGARGLMQLMPATAKTVAPKLGLPAPEETRLTSEPALNLQLGRAYLAEVMAQFDNNPVLAAAAYNAGPNRVRQWLNDFGDPRSGAVDPLDWIEQIPFTETRLYVQRVIENTRLYRQILQSTARAPLGIERSTP